MTTRLGLLLTLVAALAVALAATPAKAKEPYAAEMWGRSGHVTVPRAAEPARLIARAPAVAAPRRAPFYTVLFLVATTEGSVRDVAVLYAPSLRAVAGNRSRPGLGWRRASPRLVVLLRPSLARLRPYRTPRGWPPGMKSPYGLDALAPR
jgi:hypothetical protein